MFKATLLTISLSLLLVFSASAQSTRSPALGNLIEEIPSSIVDRANKRHGVKEPHNEDNESTRSNISRSETTYIASPHQGYLDTLHGPTNLKLLEEAVVGQVALFYMALTQTEPALAAGLSSANQFSSQIHARAHSDLILAQNRAIHSPDQNSKNTLHLLYQCMAENSKDKEIDNSENLIELCSSRGEATAREPEELTASDRGLDISHTFGHRIVYPEQNS